VGNTLRIVDVTMGQSSRGDAKRERILEAATRLFAERGYAAARAEDVAKAAGIAKGSVFQHFGSKEGLFLEVYKRAMASFSAYLAAPEAVLRQGFFATLRYWLERTEGALREDWVPCRIALLGNYGADLTLRREINRFLKARDPYGTTAFVRWGIKRGEVRQDVDEDMIVSILDWTVERFQDALLVEELDPGLFRRPGPQARTEARIEQFLELLRSAIGAKRVAKAPPRREAHRR
jgi:TetR/AcrR family transcriptional regulator